MDERELAEIEARANAATPGPWCASTGRTYDTTTGKVAHVEHYVSRGDDDVGIASDVCDSRTGEQSEPNARFIAAARTDVPALVAEVRRLTAALDAARREGAEGMRAAALRCCSPDDDHFDGFHAPDVWEQIEREIRALPLDAPGGAS